MDGSYVVQGDDTGIGSGQGDAVQDITILDGFITVKGGTDAEIGVGFGPRVN
jgi:hypothetical protein